MTLGISNNGHAPTIPVAYRNENVGKNQRQSHDFNSSTIDENSKEHHQDVYNRIFEQITDRYAKFDPEMETGFKGTPGVTGDIENITNKDLISMLFHIGDNEKLLNSSFENSGKSALFDKIYLASNEQQGWNLRLHRFKVGGNGLGGNGLGDEDDPHFHRWTLASSIKTGGYMNVNYKESEVDDSHLAQPGFEKDEYSKYLLPATKDQIGKKGREATLLNKKVIMTPSKQEIFAQEDLNHFPIRDAHSVKAMPEYMGTTITLAHTGKSQKTSSITYVKNEKLEISRQVKYEKIEDLKKAIDNQIAFLQILDLNNDLHDFLNKKQESGRRLTGGELNHLEHREHFNHVETSLLPALAIYRLEKVNNVPHRDFSEETVDFLDEKLANIDANELSVIIETNQSDLIDKKFTIEEDRKGNPEFFRALDERKAFEGIRNLFR